MALVLAHRGASHAAPENTLEAFAVARRLGADGVELDVRRSADGELVVHHDAEVAGRGPVSSLAAAELPPAVPSLEAALRACSGLVVNIELKDLPGEPGFDPTYPLPQAVARLVAEVLAAGLDVGHRVVVRLVGDRRGA
ncbi:MAG TPA: glycerophosphodiester phosphodiesterase [Acidimicrobiales bacterium]|nr:glycerophosphodiester phosphodiesterase [Acidimicrobiales bacterium]